MYAIDSQSMLHETGVLIEQALEKRSNETDPDFGVIYDAMRYSLLAGGKRLRPLLTLEFARLAARENDRGADETIAACDAACDAAIPYACAIEMIHTYSLIHDDLPCMDDDELRRGRPTSHIKFGEANALLAGDALLTKAFATAADNPLVPAETTVRAVKLLADCAGAAGMVGGQVLDLAGESKEFSFETLERLQSLKTGELIRCASLLGCLAGGASDALMKAAEVYAMGIGRAFQVVDDILNVTGDEAILGKPVGSDIENEKTTFLTFMSIREANAYAERLTTSAKEAIAAFAGSERLQALADYLLTRNI